MAAPVRGKAEGATKRKAPRGRLPRYYGKVGLSRQQRTRIYAIQATYRQQVEALTRQIMVLREREGKETETVLTVLQRDRLKEFLAMAEAARKARALRKAQQKGSQRGRQKGPLKNGPPFRSKGAGTGSFAPGLPRPLPPKPSPPARRRSND